MKYLLKPDFEDIACLDDSLIGLLFLVPHRALYYHGSEGNYSVLIDTESTLEQVLHGMNRYMVVAWKMKETKELTDEEYSSLLGNYTPYTKSVLWKWPNQH